MQHQTFHASELVSIAAASSFRGDAEPTLKMGNVVRLNSGGPQSVVVDVCGESVTVAWRDRDNAVHEATLPEPCFHRVVLGDGSAR
jgi:uncharacterized protein YodC (DUF2158 family)